METTESSFLTTKQVAKILNCAEGTLNNYRARRVGIPYYKIGKKVVYDVKDVEDYLRKQRVEPEG